MPLSDQHLTMLAEQLRLKRLLMMRLWLMTLLVCDSGLLSPWLGRPAEPVRIRGTRM